MSRSAPSRQRIGSETVLPVAELRERILEYGDAVTSKPSETWRPRTDQEVRFWTGMEKAILNDELNFYTQRATKFGFQGFWEVLRPIVASGQFDAAIARWVDECNPTFFEGQTALGNVAGVDDDGWMIFRDKIQGKRSRNHDLED